MGMPGRGTPLTGSDYAVSCNAARLPAIQDRPGNAKPVGGVFCVLIAIGGNNGSASAAGEEESGFVQATLHGTHHDFLEGAECRMHRSRYCNSSRMT